MASWNRSMLAWVQITSCRRLAATVAGAMSVPEMILSVAANPQNRFPAVIRLGSR